MKVLFPALVKFIPETARKLDSIGTEAADLIPDFLSLPISDPVTRREMAEFQARYGLQPSTKPLGNFEMQALDASVDELSERHQFLSNSQLGNLFKGMYDDCKKYVYGEGEMDLKRDVNVTPSMLDGKFESDEYRALFEDVLKYEFWRRMIDWLESENSQSQHAVSKELDELPNLVKFGEGEQKLFDLAYGFAIRGEKVPDMIEQLKKLLSIKMDNVLERARKIAD